MQADKLIERKVKARQFDYISYKIYLQKKSSTLLSQTLVVPPNTNRKISPKSFGGFKKF